MAGGGEEEKMQMPPVPTPVPTSVRVKAEDLGRDVIPRGTCRLCDGDETCAAGLRGRRHARLERGQCRREQGGGRMFWRRKGCHRLRSDQGWQMKDLSVPKRLGGTRGRRPSPWGCGGGRLHGGVRDRRG